MPHSTTYANNVLNYTFGKTKTLTAPSYVYVALSSNDPEADGGTFTELSGGNYSRVMIEQNGYEYPAKMSAATARKILNAEQINWNKATADWATAKGFALFDAKSGGNMIFYGKLAQDVTVVEGAVALFEPEGFALECATTDNDATTTT